MKRRKDGRFQTSFTAQNPLTGEKSRHYVYADTEEQLAIVLARKEKEAEDVTAYINGVISFSEWCAECLKVKQENGASEVTIESYQRCLNNHVFPFLPPNMRLADVKPFHIKSILQRIAGKRTKEYAYAILKTIFSEAVFEGLLSDNPCSHVRKPKAEAAPAAFLPPDVFHLIIESVKDSIFYYVFLLAFYTGCRRGELCALRWSDFAESKRTLKIDKAMKETKALGLHEGNAKSRHGVRILPLPLPAVELLIKWREKLKAILIDKALPFDENGYVFRSPKFWDKPLPPTAITRKMSALRSELHLPSRTCMHSFRHTHATNLAAQGIQSKKLQMQMGHASAAFTLDTYVHSSPDLTAGVAPLIEKMSEVYNKD